MKRKILILASLFVAHFVASVVLSVLVYLSILGSFVGAPSSESDRIIAWVLIVLLFPVRNFGELIRCSSRQLASRLLRVVCDRRRKSSLERNNLLFCCSAKISAACGITNRWTGARG